MRLILTLQSRNSIKQEDFNKKYYTAMHGFIYKILASSKELSKIHDIKEYTPFCFGNLFPIKNELIKQGELYKVIISSSNPKIIETLFFGLTANQEVNLGEGAFFLKNMELKILKLNKNSILENMTPINLTYSDKGVLKAVKFSSDKNKFLELLRKNLIKKYNYFSGNRIPLDYKLFDNVEILPYKKPDSAFEILVSSGDKQHKFTIIGSKIILKFQDISDEQLRIFQYLFDMGFGERTSFGAGFMIERWKKR